MRFPFRISAALFALAGMYAAGASPLGADHCKKPNETIMAELNAAAGMLDSRDVAIACQAARRFLDAWERAEELAAHTDCFHGKSPEKVRTDVQEGKRQALDGIKKFCKE
jgi:hypothetical protein